MAPGKWAQMEFSSAQLGDKRRTERLVTVAEGLARHPGGTLPQAFPEWAELKAAYRFFSQPEITYEEICDRTGNGPVPVVGNLASIC